MLLVLLSDVCEFIFQRNCLRQNVIIDISFKLFNFACPFIGYFRIGWRGERMGGESGEGRIDEMYTFRVVGAIAQ